MQTTRAIAGKSISLEPGRRYRAEGVDGRVDIRDLTSEQIVLQVPVNDRRQVSEFVNEFNNESSSFAGQLWQ